MQLQMRVHSLLVFTVPTPRLFVPPLVS